MMQRRYDGGHVTDDLATEKWEREWETPPNTAAQVLSCQTTRVSGASLDASVKGCAVMMSLQSGNVLGSPGRRG